jgi:hypothetical protein
MPGLSAIDATTTPDNVVLLRESVNPHRTPRLHCTTSPRSAVIDAEDETPLRL